MLVELVVADMRRHVMILVPHGGPDRWTSLLQVARYSIVPSYDLDLHSDSRLRMKRKDGKPEAARCRFRNKIATQDR